MYDRRIDVDDEFQCEHFYYVVLLKDKTILLDLYEEELRKFEIFKRFEIAL